MGLLSALLTLALVVVLLVLVLWPLLEDAPRAGKNLTGAEALIGLTADVTRPFSSVPGSCEKYGHVRVQGETWKARLLDESSAEITIGDRVTIVGVDGLCLAVQSAGEPQMDPPTPEWPLPRLVVYPVLLIALPVLAMSAGRWLGEYGPTARLAVWPGIGGAVGNWVLFLLGAGVVLAALAILRYERGRRRTSPWEIAATVAGLGCLLMAGSTGLIFMGIVGVILTAAE